MVGYRTSPLGRIVDSLQRILTTDYADSADKYENDYGLRG